MCIFALRHFFVKTEYRPIYQVNTHDNVTLSVAIMYEIYVYERNDIE